MPTALEYKDQGNTAFKAGNFAEAISYYEKALEVDASYVPALFNKFLCLKKLDKDDDHLSLLKKVLQIDPNHEKAMDLLYELGMEYYSRKKYQDAQNYLHFLKQHITREVPIVGGGAAAAAAAIIKIPKTIDLLKLSKTLRNIEEQIDAKIVFQIVDLKFTREEKVKILEMGLGMESGYLGLAAINGGLGSAPPLIDALRGLGLPGRLTAYPAMHGPDDIEGLVEDIAAWPMPAESDRKKLKGFSGILCGNHYHRNKKPTLLVDDLAPVGLAIVDKLTMHHIATAARIDIYRPDTELFTIGEDVATAVRRILGKIKTDIIVLKAPDLERGEGVEFIHRDGLALRLAKLTPPMMINENESASSAILLESFEPSKTVKKEGLSYDGTMRVYLTMVRNEGTWEYHCLGANWKLPPLSTNSKDFRNSTLSSFHGEPRALAVDAKDLETINTQLKIALTAFYEAALAFPLEDYIDRLLKRAATKQEGFYLSVRLANILGSLGWSEEALEILNNLENHKSPDAQERIHHERARIYFSGGEYAKAIESFNKALTINAHGMDTTHYFLALAYAHLGKIDEFKREQAIIKLSQGRNPMAPLRLIHLNRSIKKTPPEFRFRWTSGSTDYPHDGGSVTRKEREEACNTSEEEKTLGSAALMSLMTRAAGGRSGVISSIFAAAMGGAGAPTGAAPRR